MLPIGSPRMTPFRSDVTRMSRGSPGRIRDVPNRVAGTPIHDTRVVTRVGATAIPGLYLRYPSSAAADDGYFFGPIRRLQLEATRKDGWRNVLCRPVMSDSWTTVP